MKTRDESATSMKEAIVKSLGLVNYQYAEGVKTIVIRPNMCYYWDYTTDQTADPKFMASLINVLCDEIPTKTDIFIVARTLKLP